MKKRTKKKLSRKMAAICTVFALTISVTLGVMGFYTYYHNSAQGLMQKFVSGQSAEND